MKNPTSFGKHMFFACLGSSLSLLPQSGVQVANFAQSRLSAEGVAKCATSNLYVSFDITTLTHGTRWSRGPDTT